MAIILPANTLAAGGFEVANSCRFNDGDSAYIHQTPGGNGSNTAFTLSLWLKRGIVGTAQSLFAAGTSGVSTLDFLAGDTLAFYDGGSTTVFITNRVFRDPSAWYHIALICNTGESGTDKCKLYINGVLETSFSTDNRSSLDAVNHVNQTVQQAFGQSGTGSQYLDGYLAEIVMLDGTATAIGNLGEYDDDSPTIWKPIDVSGLSFGTNGYYLDFEDSSNLGNNAGSGAADFTEVNLAAADQATDTPTNNFCVLNSINPRHSDLTMSEGNCALASSNGQWLGVSSTMAVSRGKWYAEWKYISGHNMKFGIVGNGGADVAWLTANVSYGGYLPVGYEYQYNNSGTGYRVNNNVSPSWSNGSFSSADSIIMMAFDADAGKIWWGRDGTWFNNTGTANPATGSDASTSSISSDNAPYIISCALEGSGSTGFVNFGGCSAFAISSAVADGDGYGAFEFAPPSGYFSICTKNLAEYG